MNGLHAPLLRHLAWILVLKVLVLVLLWWCFVRDARVTATAAVTAAHVLTAPAPLAGASQ